MNRFLLLLIIIPFYACSKQEHPYRTVKYDIECLKSDSFHIANHRYVPNSFLKNNKELFIQRQKKIEKTNAILDKLEQNGFKIVISNNKLFATPIANPLTKNPSAQDLAKCSDCGGMNGWLPYPEQRPQLWLCRCQLEQMQRATTVTGWIFAGAAAFSISPASVFFCTFAIEGISICLDEVMVSCPMGIMIDFHNGYFYAQH